jgi:hypothetical protein
MATDSSRDKTVIHGKQPTVAGAKPLFTEASQQLPGQNRYLRMATDSCRGKTVIHGSLPTVAGAKPLFAESSQQLSGQNRYSRKPPDSCRGKTVICGWRLGVKGWDWGVFA